MFPWGILFFGITILALQGYVREPQHPVLRFLLWQGWCVWLIIVVPATIGEFARAETSPLPWQAFEDAKARYGTFDGVFSFVDVCLVHLWIFWIPAHLWIGSHPDIDKQKKIMARLINVLAGLMLTSAHNTFYRMLEYLTRGEL